MTKEQGTLFDDLPASVGFRSKHPLYGVWRSMIARCHRATHPNFGLYGGRGIVVCEEWRASSRAFVAWAIRAGWQAGLQIDREDNNGPYSPGNCRFVTGSVNTLNRRVTRRTSDGRPLYAVARDAGISPETVVSRLKRGWSPDEAVAVPAMPFKKLPKMRLSDGAFVADAIAARGLSASVIYGRIRRGMSPDDALSKPCSGGLGGQFGSNALADGTPITYAVAASGLPSGTVYSRIKRGWSPDDAVSIPKGGKRPSATVAIALGESEASAQGDEAQRKGSHDE